MAWRSAWPCSTCSAAGWGPRSRPACRRPPHDTKGMPDLGTIHITGGRIIDPSREVDRIGDLVIRRGRILPAGEGSEDAEVVIDARGLIVCPGLIDAHVHFREPGNEEDETI